MLKFLDSCDHYITNDVPDKWTTPIFSPSVVSGIGSCSTQGLRFGVFSQLIKGIAFGTLTGGYGHRLKITLHSVGTVLHLGGLGYNHGRHVFMTRYYDGSLAVHRDDGVSTTLLGSTPPDTIRVNDVYYVEMKAAIHNTTGTIDVKVNGVNVLSLTNQDTQSAAGSAALTSWWMGVENGNGNSTFEIDDIYIFDSAAGRVTDFLGPVRVEWLKPDGAGNYVADFSLVGAASQYLAVRDSSGPDDDTSYIQSSTSGHKHTSTFEGTGLPAGSIYGLQALLHARVTDAGFRGIKPLIRQGGADYLGTEQYPGQGYRYLHEVFENDPATTNPWNIAGVNSVEVGVQVTT